MQAWVRVLAVSMAVTGCGSGDPPAEPGTERGPCYGNGTCNAGLSCLSDICVQPAGPDAAVGSADAAVAGTDAGAPDARPHDAGSIDDAGSADAAPRVDAGTPDAGSADAQTRDADVVDGSADAGAPPDAGPPDSGARPDAGPQPMCNPVDATGCPGGTDYCRWDGNFDLLACVAPSGNRGLEQGCDSIMQDCLPGHTCVQTANQTAPECHRVCDVFDGGMSCQGLAGRHPLYNCSVINGSQQYGVCLGRGTFCDPLSPACAAAEVCGFDGAGQTVCQAAGPVQRDQSCSVVNNCAVGQGICIDLGAGGSCRLACDPNQANACGMNSRCTQITNRPFGVCLPVTCHPFDLPCPMGSVCSAVAGPVECRTAGAVGIGGACALAQECAAPGVCVDLGSGPRCEAPCDGANPCGAPQVCVNLQGFGFGVCR